MNSIGFANISIMYIKCRHVPVSIIKLNDTYVYKINCTMELKNMNSMICYKYVGV